MCIGEQQPGAARSLVIIVRTVQTLKWPQLGVKPVLSTLWSLWNG